MFASCRRHPWLSGSPPQIPVRAVLVAGVAGLAAGAMSMAAGEYVSVSSQSDTKRAAIERERVAPRETPRAEFEELKAIYVELCIKTGTVAQS